MASNDRYLLPGDPKAYRVSEIDGTLMWRRTTDNDLVRQP